MMKIRQAIFNLVRQLGYEIKKSDFSERQISHFECCLYLLTNMRQKLNIVQVGANDGMINDPLFEFISNNPTRTRIILCEPQEYLIPELEKNYSFQDAKYIYNGAIGPEPSLRLFRIRRECWGECSVPYARGWPEYRAPTGVTSSRYDHVSAWVLKHYKGSLRLQDVIEDVWVECVDIREIVKRAGLFDTIDLLQVDAEGFDDQVIYASDIGGFLPLVIHFEYGNLSQKRAQFLREYLKQMGYTFSQHGIDGLAIRTINPAD